MAGEDSLPVFRKQRVENGRRPLGRLIERHHRFRADGAARAVPEVDDDVVHARLRHGEGLIRRGGERFGEHALPARVPQNVDFFRETHAGFFQVFPEIPVDKSDGGAIHHSVEARRLDSVDEPAHVPCGISTQQARDHGAFPHHAQDGALAQFERDGVRVSDGQIARHGAQALHPVVGEIEGGDEVRSAARGEFRRDAASAQRVVDGAPGVPLGPQASHNLTPGYAHNDISLQISIVCLVFSRGYSIYYHISAYEKSATSRLRHFGLDIMSAFMGKWTIERAGDLSPSKSYCSKDKLQWSRPPEPLRPDWGGAARDHANQSVVMIRFR